MSASTLFFAWLSLLSCCLSWASASPVIEVKVHQTPIGQSITVLTIQPEQVRLLAIHANQSIFGRATLGQIAKQAGALAGINGGFFRMSQNNNGFPAGILKIGPQWYGIAYRNRGAVAWKHHGPLHFDRIRTQTRLFLGEEHLPLRGLNLAFGSHPHLLYSDVFGQQEIPLLRGQAALLFNSERIEQVLLPSLIKPSPEASPAFTTIKIPPGHFAYLSPELRPDPEYYLGKSLRLEIQIFPEFEPSLAELWPEMDFIVGGAPLLIKNRQIIRDYDPEQLNADFVYRPHARSAIGVLEDGRWVFVVADQNLLNKDPGMTLPELARFMKQLGCESALNLDGGISSSLYFEDKLLNNPLIEREIGDAILVLPHTQSDPAEAAAAP